MNLIEAIKENNPVEFFRLLNLKPDPSGKKIIDEVDAEYGGSPLYWAMALGHTHFINPLIEAGAAVNTPNKNDATPVFIAAKSGHAPAIAVLHAAGANMNTQYPDGATPVYIAAQNGHASVITALHAVGANMDMPMSDGTTPVYVAAQNGHAAVITALHAAGANVNTPENKCGWTPVFIAARNGHASVITALHAAGAKMDTPMSDGTTSVYIAAQRGHAPAIAALHAAGANMNAPRNGGFTPVFVAAENGHASAIAALHAAGADVDMPEKDGFTPVYIAAGMGHALAIAALHAAGANMNTSSKDGFTPVFIAAQQGHVAALKLLLEAGADANIANVKTKQGTALELVKRGKGPKNTEVVRLLEAHLKQYPKGIKPANAISSVVSFSPNPSRSFEQKGLINVHPLFSAIIHKTPSQVAQMIDSGSNVNMRTLDGAKTPLHVACHRGDLQMVTLLLSKKADIAAITDAGFTPLHAAAQNGFTKIITELVAAGAFVNAATKVGCTPLHESAANGHEEATLKLLELRAEPNLKDFRYNLTAANLAHENGHTKIRDILCTKISFQDSFIQNVNFILFNWGRLFSPDTEEAEFMQQLAADIKDLKNADEVFKIVQHALKSPRYNLVQEPLKPVKQLLIQNMKKYNEDKIAALKTASEISDITHSSTAADHIKVIVSSNAVPNMQNENQQKRFSKKK